MKKLEWSDKLTLGVEQIDEQHQQLVQLANDLVSAVEAGYGEDVLDVVFKELREYTVFHFKEEELYMKEIEYPGRREHVVEHANLKEQVKQYQREMYAKKDVSPDEVVVFLRNWLVEHIILNDMEIAQYLKDKARSGYASG